MREFTVAAARGVPAACLMIAALLLAGCPEPYHNPTPSNTTATPPRLKPGVTAIHFSSSPSAAQLYLSDKVDSGFALVDFGNGSVVTPYELAFDWNKLTGVDTVWFRVRFGDGAWSDPKSVVRGQRDATLRFTPSSTTVPPASNSAGTTPPTTAAGGALDDAWTSEDQ